MTKKKLERDRPASVEGSKKEIIRLASRLVLEHEHPAGLDFDIWEEIDGEDIETALADAQLLVEEATRLRDRISSQYVLKLQDNQR